ncbi:MAG: hypothetical protein SFW64_01440 [Alphaproteobacteria bacterium]|nr:hypothetical protein [Alphaproteobacteria bacterium]
MTKDKITVTELRSKIYQVFDHVIATGEPCEVVRDGQSVIISAKRKKAPSKGAAKKEHWFEKLERMGPRKPSVILCDEETLIYGKLDAWDGSEKW